MLTPEQIEAMANQSFRDYMDDKNDDHDMALARAVEAATLATVTPLVQQFMDAHNYVKHTPREQYDEKHGAKLMNDAANAGSAFLSGATKESTDA